jgi:CelD/BcsL family acetyltransferase involved in cellulose biosynthesis
MAPVALKHFRAKWVRPTWQQTAMHIASAATAKSTAPTRVEWRPFATLAAIAPQWRALAARALAPNVFYEPAFALPAASVWGHALGAGLVWSHTDRLIGLFPARIERRYGLPVLVGWTHPYGPLGTPLVDRDDAEAIVTAWLDYVAAGDELPFLAILPLVPEQGLFATALAAALARRSLPSALFGHHRRALLAPGDDRVQYVEQSIGAKKRKELRRQRHRLADLGTLKIDHTSNAPLIAEALGDFLDVEARGWKGRAGTAAANHEDISRFIDSAVAELAAEGKARIDRLRIDGQTVAAAVTLRSGASAWTWKIAYDEAFARSSPGVQLMIELTEALLADASIAAVDSCATADHPMIDHLWRERLALADHLIAVRPAPFAFPLACRLEALRRTAIGTAKTLRDRMRSRTGIIPPFRGKD